MANQFFTDERTVLMQKLVNEIVSDPTTYRGHLYFPAVNVSADRIQTEVVEANGGFTSEHVMGADVKYIQNFGTRVQEFAPGYYKEAIHFNEADILKLRKLGQEDRSERGIQQYLDKGIDRLNRRLETRMELLRWAAVFQGSFTYLGRTFSYGIPAANTAVPIGAKWSLDGISANAAADPIADIRYWLEGGLSAFRKYNVSKIVMNANTARWIMTNPNVRAYITSFGANQAITSFEINKVLNFLIPGLPEVDVYKGWYQTETVVNGKIVVGDPIFFIPDGKLFFDVTIPGNEVLGEMVLGLNLATGSIAAPGSGKFIVPDENIAPGTKGGPANPYMDVVGGFNGGLKLDRSFDILTGNVL